MGVYLPPPWMRGRGLLLLEYPEPNFFVMMPVWGVHVEMTRERPNPFAEWTRSSFEANGRFGDYVMYDHVPDFSDFKMPEEPEQSELSPPRLGLPAPK